MPMSAQPIAGIVVRYTALASLRSKIAPAATAALVPDISASRSALESWPTPPGIQSKEERRKHEMSNAALVAAACKPSLDTPCTTGSHDWHAAQVRFDAFVHLCSGLDVHVAWILARGRALNRE